MTASPSLVSIGLPVFNAGEQIHEVLATILAQDYPYFELIISDNASTDQTRAICQEYAAQDERVRLYQNETNIGAVGNFQRVFDLSSGDYFVWIAHDDRWETGYLRACVEMLDTHPEAVLCYTDQTAFYTATGTTATIIYNFAGDNPSFSGRVRALLADLAVPYAIIYGLFRRELVQPAFPFPTTAISDIHFLLKAARYGIFIHVPQVLFRRVITPKDFKLQMRRMYGRNYVLPRWIVYIAFWMRLLRFAFTAGSGIIEKMIVAWAVSRFIGYRVVLNMIPRWLRKLLRHYAPVRAGQDRR